MAYFTDTQPLTLNYVPPKTGSTYWSRVAGLDENGQTTGLRGKINSFLPWGGLMSKMASRSLQKAGYDDAAAEAEADAGRRAQTFGSVLKLGTGIARAVGGDLTGLQSAVQGATGLVGGLAAPQPPPPPGRQQYVAFSDGGPGVDPPERKVVKTDATRTVKPLSPLVIDDNARQALSKELSSRQSSIGPQVFYTPEARQGNRDYHRRKQVARSVAQVGQGVGGVMQLARIVPHPVAQAIAGAGSGLTAMSSSYLAGDDYRTGDYEGMALNLLGTGIGGRIGDAAETAYDLAGGDASGLAVQLGAGIAGAKLRALRLADHVPSPLGTRTTYFNPVRQTITQQKGTLRGDIEGRVVAPTVSPGKLRDAYQLELDAIDLEPTYHESALEAALLGKHKEGEGYKERLRDMKKKAKEMANFRVEGATRPGEIIWPEGVFKYNPLVGFTWRERTVRPSLEQLKSSYRGVGTDRRFLDRENIIKEEGWDPDALDDDELGVRMATTIPSNPRGGAYQGAGRLYTTTVLDEAVGYAKTDEGKKGAVFRVTNPSPATTVDEFYQQGIPASENITLTEREKEIFDEYLDEGTLKQGYLLPMAPGEPWRAPVSIRVDNSFGSDFAYSEAINRVLRDRGYRYLYDNEPNGHVLFLDNAAKAERLSHRQMEGPRTFRGGERKEWSGFVPPSVYGTRMTESTPVYTIKEGDNLLALRQNAADKVAIRKMGGQDTPEARQKLASGLLYRNLVAPLLDENETKIRSMRAKTARQWSRDIPVTTSRNWFGNLIAPVGGAPPTGNQKGSAGVPPIPGQKFINGEPLVIAEQATGRIRATMDYDEGIFDQDATEEILDLAEGGAGNDKKLGAHVRREVGTWENKEDNPNPTTPMNAKGGYVVREGDTLSGLAARYGTTVAALARDNNIADVNVIRAGHNLIIPGAREKAAVAVRPLVLQDAEADPDAGGRRSGRLVLHDDPRRGVYGTMRTRRDDSTAFGGGSFGGAGAGGTLAIAQPAATRTGLRPVVIAEDGGLARRRVERRAPAGGVEPATETEYRTGTYDLSPASPRPVQMLPVHFDAPEVAGPFDYGPVTAEEFHDEIPMLRSRGPSELETNFDTHEDRPELFLPDFPEEESAPVVRPLRRPRPAAQTKRRTAAAPSAIVVQRQAAPRSPHRGAYVPGDRATPVDSTYVYRPGTGAPVALRPLAARGRQAGGVDGYAHGGYGPGDDDEYHGTPAYAVGGYGPDEWADDPPIRLMNGYNEFVPRPPAVAGRVGVANDFGSLAINAPSNLSGTLARSLAARGGPAAPASGPGNPGFDGGVFNEEAVAGVTLPEVVVKARRPSGGAGGGRRAAGGTRKPASPAATTGPGPDLRFVPPALDPAAAFVETVPLTAAEKKAGEQAEINRTMAMGHRLGVLENKPAVDVTGKTASPNPPLGGGNKTDTDKGKVDWLSSALDATRLLTGAMMASTKIPRYEKSARWNAYVDAAGRLSKRGLSEAERGAAERGIQTAQQTGNAAVLSAAGGGGNAGAVLAGLAAQTAAAGGQRMSLSVQDAAMQRQNNALYGNVLAQDNAYDLNRFGYDYQGAIADRQTGASLVGQTLAGGEGRRNYNDLFREGGAYDKWMRQNQAATTTSEDSLKNNALLDYLKKAAEALDKK